MGDESKKLLIFIDTKDHDGHEADFRFSLDKALGNTPRLIFEDFPKTPQNMFNATIGGILYSNAVLLDDVSQKYKFSPNSLIQYGICYALEKRCMYVAIKNNSRKQPLEIKTTMVEGWAEFDFYLDFAMQFKSKFLEWLASTQSVCRVKPNKLAVHSFITFGIDRWENLDLYEIVSNFGVEKGWTPRIVLDVGSFSKLESLAKAVSQRSFCVFCIDRNNQEEIFLGIGLAIGMGRPFLIIKHEDTELLRL